MKLTEKQQTFVREYIGNGRNAAAAYRAAYNVGSNDDQARVEGFRLLRNPKIAPLVAEVDARASAAIERAIDAAAFTQEELARRLLQLGLYDVRSLFSWSAAGVRLKPSDEISEDAAFAIQEIREMEGGRLVVKLADKRQALMDYGRLRGWLVDRKQNLGADGKPIDPPSGPRFVLLESV